MSRRRFPEHGWLACYRELLGIWTRRSSNSFDAEDAAHDAIANMLGGDASVIRDPRAYLHRSIHNGLASRFHRQAREDAVPLHELHETDHPAQDDLESTIRAAQLSEALYAALNELPPRCRQVFAWHRLEGWTVPEIASHMRLSVSSVEKSLARAMRHIHERLQRFSHGSP